jgi:hypothetical protein
MEFNNTYVKFVNIIEYYNLLDKLTNNSTDETADIISQIVYILYKDKYVSTKLNNSKVWYEFKNNAWICIDSISIRKIVLEIKEYLIIYVNSLLNQQQIKLSKIINNYQNKYLNKIIELCFNKYFDGDFLNKLKRSENLIGFMNGIYDLDKACFIPGEIKATDYISTFVKNDYKEYNEEYYMNNPMFSKIYNFFSETQIDDNMREYLLEYCARSLK